MIYHLGTLANNYGLYVFAGLVIWLTLRCNDERQRGDMYKFQFESLHRIIVQEDSLCMVRAALAQQFDAIRGSLPEDCYAAWFMSVLQGEFFREPGRNLFPNDTATPQSCSFGARAILNGRQSYMVVGTCKEIEPGAWTCVPAFVVYVETRDPTHVIRITYTESGHSTFEILVIDTLVEGGA